MNKVIPADRNDLWYSVFAAQFVQYGTKMSPAMAVRVAEDCAAMADLAVEAFRVMEERERQR